ncbi:MAG: hypothetical protein ACREOS_06600 [Candidatus Dormibacteraceae bacterium]
MGAESKLAVDRIPGFLKMLPVEDDNRRFDLSFRVEGGSHVDARDAAEEIVFDCEDALERYYPKVLLPLVIEPAS